MFIYLRRSDSSDDEYHHDNYKIVTPPPDPGRTLVNINTSYNATPLFPLPADNTIVFTNTVPNTFTTEVQKTPTDTNGVATVIPPLKGAPDSANVCLTLLPGYVVIPNANIKINGIRFNSSWNAIIFGRDDEDVMYPYFANVGQPTYPIKIPITSPAYGSTYTIGIWLAAIENYINNVTFKVGTTTCTLIDSDHDPQYGTNRYIFQYTFTGTPGTNQMLPCSIYVDGTDFAILAVQVPLGFKGGFKMNRFVGSENISHDQFYQGELSRNTFSAPKIFNPDIPYNVDHNGYFNMPIYVRGNYYGTGSGVGVNYVSTYNTNYSEFTLFPMSPSNQTGLNKTSLVYQGYPTVGLGWGYVTYVEAE